MKKKFLGRPKSICAAPDWFATYTGETGKISVIIPLACWCLTDQETIEGMVVAEDGTVFAVDLLDTFYAYIHKSELKTLKRE